MREPEELTVPGLTNTGNSCYFNAIIQALASSQRFRQVLREQAELQQQVKRDTIVVSSNSTEDGQKPAGLLARFWTKGPQGSRQPDSEADADAERRKSLTLQLLPLLDALQPVRGRPAVLHPGDALTALRSRVSDGRLAHGDQHDASEAVLALMDVLKDDARAAYERESARPGPSHDFGLTSLVHSCRRQHSVTHQPVVELFRTSAASSASLVDPDSRAASRAGAIALLPTPGAHGSAPVQQLAESRCQLHGSGEAAGSTAKAAEVATPACPLLDGKRCQESTSPGFSTNTFPPDGCPAFASPSPLDRASFHAAASPRPPPNPSDPPCISRSTARLPAQWQQQLAESSQHLRRWHRAAFAAMQSRVRHSMVCSLCGNPSAMQFNCSPVVDLHCPRARLHPGSSPTRDTMVHPRADLAMCFDSTFRTEAIQDVICPRCSAVTSLLATADIRSTASPAMTLHSDAAAGAKRMENRSSLGFQVLSSGLEARGWQSKQPAGKQGCAAPSANGSANDGVATGDVGTDKAAVHGADKEGREQAEAWQSLLRIARGSIPTDSLQQDVEQLCMAAGVPWRACRVKMLRTSALVGLPPALVLHVNRTIWTSFGPLKLAGPVPFPFSLRFRVTERSTSEPQGHDGRFEINPGPSLTLQREGNLAVGAAGSPTALAWSRNLLGATVFLPEVEVGPPGLPQLQRQDAGATPNGAGTRQQPQGAGAMGGVEGQDDSAQADIASKDSGASYASTMPRSLRYRLVAVVVHWGLTASWGHYATFRRVAQALPPTGRPEEDSASAVESDGLEQWCLISDDKVAAASREQVVAAAEHATLLVYDECG